MFLDDQDLHIIFELIQLCCETSLYRNVIKMEHCAFQLFVEGPLSAFYQSCHYSVILIVFH